MRLWRRYHGYSGDEYCHGISSRHNRLLGSDSTVGVGLLIENAVGGAACGRDVFVALFVAGAIDFGE